MGKIPKLNSEKNDSSEDVVKKYENLLKVPGAPCPCGYKKRLFKDCHGMHKLNTTSEKDPISDT